MELTYSGKHKAVKSYSPSPWNLLLYETLPQNILERKDTSKLRDLQSDLSNLMKTSGSAVSERLRSRNDEPGEGETGNEIAEGVFASFYKFLE